MPDNPLGSIRSTVSLVIARTPVVLYRVILLVSVTGGDISVYEGLDATSGRLIATIKGTANVSNTVDFGGVRCDRGLYVAVGSNVTEYTVVYSPIPV
jgi:hypothetical protein